MGDALQRSTRYRRHTLCADTLGASEIIGTVLVIAITIGAITIVLLLGLPTLERAQRDEQYRSMIAQFEIFDETVSNMVREGRHSQRPFQFSLGSGYLTAGVDQDRWVVTCQYHRSNRIEFVDLADGDNTTYLRSYNLALRVDIMIYWRHGLDHGETHLEENVMNNDTIRTRNAFRGVVELVATDHSTGNLLARAWLFETSAVAYHLDTASGKYSLFYENGGLLKRPGSAEERFIGSPMVHEHTPEEGINGIDAILTMRAVLFDANTSFTSGSQRGEGSETLDFLFNLDYNAPGENSQLENLIIEINGDHEDAWLDHLSDSYRFNRIGSRLEYMETPLRFHFGYSIMSIEQR